MRRTADCSKSDRRGFMARVAAGLGATVVANSGSAQAASAQTRPMVSLTVIYPNRAGARFDLAYYRASHIPLVVKVMKAVNVILVEGVPMGEAAPPYAMIAHIQFDSMETLQSAVANPAMADVRADVARFTDITPTIMFGRSV